MLTSTEITQLLQEKILTMPLPKEPQSLYEPISYSLTTGGKRIRPLLCVLSANLFTSEINDSILWPAIGLETFHGFTLLHDDIMDHADIRRGKPTVVKKWGENVAILSGDAMLIQAYKLIAQAPKEKLPQVLQFFNRVAAQVCEGQQYDMDNAELCLSEENDYLSMIRLKTAVLLAEVCYIGAILGDAQETDAQLLYAFGENLGMAFQLQDDYLDTFGDEQSFGKKIGGDIVEGKQTFLVAKALQSMNPQDADLLKELLKTKSLSSCDKITAVKQLYHNYGVEEQTQNKIEHYFSLALEALSKISVPKESKIHMENFAHELLKRQF